MNEAHQQKLIELRAAAQQAMAQYPQYDGYYDEYVLCRITKRQNRRFGGDILFEVGDIAICEPNHRFPADHWNWGISVFCSNRDFGNLVVMEDHLTLIPEEEAP